MKAVMLSIRPRWCELIASGEKTIEVRKTRPKLDAPFKCYIYETFGKKHWADIPIPQDQGGGVIYDKVRVGGKVIGEFTCNKIENLFGVSRFWIGDEIEKETCLTKEQIREYANGNESIYGWHISDLKIYDRPIPINRFHSACDRQDRDCDLCRNNQLEPYQSEFEDRHSCNKTLPLQRPPQSWCYVEEVENP